MDDARKVETKYGKRLKQIGVGGCCMIVALVSGIASSARADLVSGRVYLDGQALPNQTCPIVGQTPQVQTNAQGAYHVFLPAGAYTVECTMNGTPYTCSIHASSQPVQQDCLLTPK